MGKITLRGPVPKDDPMFSGGAELYSRAGSSAPADAKRAQEPEVVDEKADGEHRVAKFKHQNEQMRKQSKG